MIHRVLYIGKWIIDFLFSVDGYDRDEIMYYLYRLGADRETVDHIAEVIDSGSPNTGFTYTDGRSHRGLVSVGPTTSGSEFVDTLVHEVHHLAVAVAANLGVDLEGETPAYLAGDAARELADVVCLLGCSDCNI